MHASATMWRALKQHTRPLTRRAKGETFGATSGA